MKQAMPMARPLILINEYPLFPLIFLNVIFKLFLNIITSLIEALICYIHTIVHTFKYAKMMPTPWHGGPIRPFGPPEGFFN
jgi:hypothetical protein